MSSSSSKRRQAIVEQLYEACFKGDVDTVNKILTPSPNGSGRRNLANAPVHGGVSAPMLVASYRGHLDILIILIKHGGNVNHQSSVNGLTPLMMAFRSGKADTIKFLDENHADPTLKSNEGKYAVQYFDVDKRDGNAYRDDYVALLIERAKENETQKKNLLPVIDAYVRGVGPDYFERYSTQKKSTAWTDYLTMAYPTISIPSAPKAPTKLLANIPKTEIPKTGIPKTEIPKTGRKAVHKTPAVPKTPTVPQVAPVAGGYVKTRNRKKKPVAEEKGCQVM